MNKTYRSVWSETDQTWVAAPETAQAKRKSAARRLAVIATGAVGMSASLLGTPASAATVGTVGQGGLELCTGAKGFAWGSSGGSETLDCSTDGKGTSDGLAFSLNNAADTKGGYGFGASTAQVAGYKNGTLNIKGASVMVYGPTTFDSVVTMSNKKIVQLAPGKVSADSTEAVNGSQLYAVAASTADVVKYDTPAHDTVTLGGAAARAPVALRNVAAGDVSELSTDAVNGAQLYAMNSAVTGDITKIHNTLMTAGWGAQADSPNPGAYQMGGFQMDAEGNVSNPAVLYVPNTTGTANPHVVLDPSTESSGYFVNGDRNAGLLPKGTVISNVADGIQDTDAANVGQVQRLIAEQGNEGGKQGLLKASSLRPAAPIASGVDTANANGAPYRTAAYYSQVRGAGDAIGSSGPTDMARANGAGSIAIGSNAQTDGRGSAALGIQSLASANDAVALGSGSVANLDNTVSVGSDGTSQRIVVNPDGTTTTVQSQLNTRRIVNMAAGQDDTDAVNVSQLRSAASALGGGAGVNAAGAFVAPSYSVGGSTVHTVGDAIANLDNRVTQNSADIAQLFAGTSADASASTATSGAHVLAATRTVLAASDVSDAAGTATDANAVHYSSDAHDQIALSSTSGENVKLSGLQNALLSADSTDAVTGQQLYTTNQQVATINQMVQNIATTGSTAVAVNSANGPAAASGTGSLAVGGGAVATGTGATAIGDKANASANNSVAIGANSIANRENAVSVGAEGSERQIVNVAAGTSGTDAVNVNQLSNALAQQSNAVNQQISSLQGSINTVSKNAYAGVAAAMAMPNLTPSGPGRTVVAAGGGYYMGGSAAAVGVTYRSQNMHWLVNGGVSVTSTGNTAARAQVGYEF